MKSSFKHALRACIFALALVTHPAHACLNDRDTLAEEARKHPDILQAITGRFERNPPLYYEMRIARVAKDLQTHPNNLDEYDDIAVACDRLGRDNEAIAWMDKKESHLATYDAQDAALTEEWYKYYANIGTARVHRWLRGGADSNRIADVEQARDEIAAAVRIKPDAHFGRETYQLSVMHWIIDNTARRGTGELVPRLSDYLVANPPDNDQGLHGAGTALAGLITLGNAWESPDIFMALGATVHRSSHTYSSHFAPLAGLRMRELLRAGHKPLFGAAASPRNDMQASQDDMSTFAELRAEADAWQKDRTDYMMARLQAGRHPDTDSTFWAEYHPAPALRLEDGLGRKLHLYLRDHFSGNGLLIEMLLYVAGFFIGVIGSIKLIRFLARRLSARWRATRNREANT